MSRALLASRAGVLASSQALVAPYPTSLSDGGFFRYNTGATNFTVVARIATAATNNGTQRWSIFWGGEQLASDGAHRSTAAEMTDSPAASDFMLSNSGSGYSVQGSGGGQWENAGIWIKVSWTSSLCIVSTSPDGVTYTQRYSFSRTSGNGLNDTWLSVQASTGNPHFSMDSISVSTP